jgi:metallo-beta-lactamase class B
LVLGLGDVAVFVVGVLVWGGPFHAPPGSSVDPGSGGGLGLTGAGAAARRASLDKAVIQRVIRSHSAEAKQCYERGLVAAPTLAGRVMVRFTIGAAGQVIDSVLEQSTMGSPAVEDCVVAAARTWQFPKPIGGGIVIVSYPFVFLPDSPGAARTVVLAAGHGGGGAVDVTTLEAGVYLHRSTDPHGVPSNGLVVMIGGAGLLLVDTAWTTEQTEAILRMGDEQLHARWLGAVITHDHPDRDGGLAALQRRRIPIAALDLTVAKLEARGVRGVTALLAARDGARQDPRGFEAFYPGPGHAPDNIVLRFPTLVFGGCLVKSMDAKDLGFTGDADLRSWPDAIRRVRGRYGETRVVPGHGPVDASGKAYQHTLELLGAAR